MRFIVVSLLTVATAAAQMPGGWTTTNQYAPAAATINVPQVNVPGLTIPQVNTIDIPSATNRPPPTAPPVRRPPPLHATSPTANQMAGSALRPKPAMLPQPKPQSSTTNFPTGSTVPFGTTPTLTGGRLLFVDQFGDDSNPGTAERPLRSIQRAAELALPGDTVVVATGEHAGFHTVRSGEKLRPIRFRAQSTNTVIRATADRKPDNIRVSDTDYIIIEGFTVRDAPRAGISVLTSRGVIVQQNIVGPNGKWGIFTGFAPEVLIFSNQCFGAGTEHGIYVSNSRDADDHPIVRANECFENAGNGIQFNGDCHAGGDGIIRNALIENNVVHDNGVKGFSLISLNDSVVQNNLVYNNGKEAGAGGIHLADEPDCGKPSAGNVIVNNTVIEPRIPGIQFSNGAKDNIVFNNIFVSDQPVTGGTGDNQIDDRSNVLRKTPETLFEASELNHYRLSVTSPARNAGAVKFAGKTAPTLSLTGQSRRTGWNINAGAYE